MARSLGPGLGIHEQLYVDETTGWARLNEAAKNQNHNSFRQVRFRELALSASLNNLSGKHNVSGDLKFCPAHASWGMP